MAAVENQNMFGVTLARILDSWTALQLAVQQGFGGPESREKARWMVHAIETWFNENDGLETYEVEDFLENVLNAEFDLILEDNSTQEIAHLICLFYRLCQENKVAEIQQRLQSLPRAAVQGCVSGGEQLDFEVDDEMVQQTALSNYSSNLPPSTPQNHQPSSASSQPANATGNSDTMDTDEQSPEDSDGWRVMRNGRKKK